MRDVVRNLILLTCLSMASPALSEDHRGGPQGGGHADYHGREFEHFTPAEREHWSGGHWEHGWHDGRFAWWWALDGFWYIYPEPFYPYPIYVPPATVIEVPPAAPVGPPPAQVWFYCDNPKGYYPYIPSCNGPWREVPATPPGTPG